MSVTVVTQIRRVVVRGSGASYSDARVLAYLRSILTTNGDLLTVASNTLARIAVGAAPAGSVPVWNGSSWAVGTLTAAVAWDDVTGKPSTFPPSTHAHTPADVTGFNAAAVDAVEAVGNGVLVTTGGTAAAVVGATTNHALLWNGTTWVAGAVPYSALSGVPSTFAPSSHTHTASEITDFATAWTAQFTAFGSGASVNDVPTWNGSTWAAAPAAGGYTDPLTTNGDTVVRAGGVTTRLPVGASGQAYVPVAGVPAWDWVAANTRRQGWWMTVGNGAPTSRIGALTATRVAASSAASTSTSPVDFQASTSATTATAAAGVSQPGVSGFGWKPFRMRAWVGVPESGSNFTAATCVISVGSGGSSPLGAGNWSLVPGTRLGCVVASTSGGNFTLYTHDGTTATATPGDTGYAPVAGDRLLIEVECSATEARCRIWRDDGTLLGSASVSGTLPAQGYAGTGYAQQYWAVKGWNDTTGGTGRTMLWGDCEIVPGLPFGGTPPW